MARARNIKPGFFRNADLVELPMEARLLFIGLWTLADRAGRLEDRPKQIKMDVFPADSVDVDGALDLIDATGMLARYEVGGKRYIQITNFTKHQNPHRDEKASTLPDMHGNAAESEQEPTVHGASTVQARCKDDFDTIAIGLTPESRSLKPDSPIPKKTATAVAPPVGVIDSVWADFCQHRKAKGAKLTQTALDGIQREAEKAGWPLEDALREICTRGWTGFKADWVADKQGRVPVPRPQAQSFAERDAAAARKRWEQMTGRRHPDSAPDAAGDFIDAPSNILEIES